MDIFFFLEETWAEVTQFDSMSDSNENFIHSNCDDSDSKSNFQTLAICLNFITQWAVTSWIIARPLEF